MEVKKLNSLLLSAAYLKRNEQQCWHNWHKYFVFQLSDLISLFYYLTDPDVAQRRMEQMERARQRLQEQHDAEAARYAEKQRIVCHLRTFLNNLFFVLLSILQ